MQSKGSCHCGAVTFTVEGTPEEVMDCNCSICRRKGALLWFVPSDAFHLNSGEDALKAYTFNREAIRHRFCGRCGIHPFGEGGDPRSGQAMVAINARCLDDFEPGGIKVHDFDGRSL